jgi:hypothetical protein
MSVTWNEGWVRIFLGYAKIPAVETCHDGDSATAISTCYIVGNMQARMMPNSQQARISLPKKGQTCHGGDAG